MTIEGACTGPIAGAKRPFDGNATGNGVRDRNGARGTRRRRNPSALKHPSKESRDGGDGDGTMRRRRRREDVGVANTHGITRAKKVLERCHRTRGIRRRKTPDDDGRTTGRRARRENGAERSGGGGNDALPHRLDAARKRGRQNISGVIQRRENLQKSVDERPPRARSIRRGGAGLHPRLQALHSGRSSDDGVTRSSGRGSEERRSLP